MLEKQRNMNKKTPNFIVSTSKSKSAPRVKGSHKKRIGSASKKGKSDLSVGDKTSTSLMVKR